MSRVFDDRFFWVIVALALSALMAAASVEDDYRQAYEMERFGADAAGAVRAYEATGDGVASNLNVFRERALFRAGICWWKLGEEDRAKKAWQQVITESGDEQLRALAGAGLAHLQSRKEWIKVAGIVVDPEGQPVPQALVLAGQWGSAPLAMTEPGGTFFVRRKLFRSEGEGVASVPVFAEHPFRRLGGATVAAPTGGAVAVRIQLLPLMDVTGRVVTATGAAVPDARISFRGWIDDQEGSQQSIPSLITTALTDANGSYCVEGLIPGLRYLVIAEKFGLEPGSIRGLFGPGAQTIPDIRMKAIEDRSISGVVTDEQGAPLSARITVQMMPPQEQILGAVLTDSDGRYRIGGLPATNLIVRVESFRGHASRALMGIPAGARDVNFALKSRNPVARTGATGRRAPDLRVLPLNAPGFTLAGLRGKPVVLYFWDRRKRMDLPRELLNLRQRWNSSQLAIVCVHDHTGYVPELSPCIIRAGLDMILTIDEYAPTEDPSAGGNATMALYGVTPGTAVLIDEAGILDSMYEAVDEGKWTDMIQRLEALVLLASGETMGGEAARRPLIGSAAPELQVSRWIRGDPLSGTDVTLRDLRGKIVVLHFGSAYVAESVRRTSYPADRIGLDSLARIFADRPVVCVWVLPSSEDSPEAERTALEVTDMPRIGIDRDNATYEMYGAGSVARNCVIDGRGIVRAVGCSDWEAFRTVRRVLGE